MPSDVKAKMYKLANRLKAQMGARFKDQEEGYIAPEIIEEADKLIVELCEICPDVISKNLESLSTLWDQMRAMETSPKRTEIAEKIFTISHEIKDMGAMCGYGLIAYFAESLRDYIARTDLNVKAQVVIIQAHVDAMQMCHRKNFRSDAGPEAEELKRMVKMAIDKYQ